MHPHDRYTDIIIVGRSSCLNAVLNTCRSDTSYFNKHMCYVLLMHLRSFLIFWNLNFVLSYFKGPCTSFCCEFLASPLFICRSMYWVCPLGDRNRIRGDMNMIRGDRDMIIGDWNKISGDMKIISKTGTELNETWIWSEETGTWSVETGTVSVETGTQSVETWLWSGRQGHN